jgi:hypothetical protein
MYYFYYTMATIFRENIVSKMGDLSICRGHHVNLVYYCHPKRQRKIDVCDYIFMEIRRAVDERMSPKYSAILQRFLNSVVPPELMRGQRIVQDKLSCMLRGDWIEEPSMAAHAVSSRSRGGSRAGSRSHHGVAPSKPTHGAARFFKTLFEVCKSSYDVNHKALQLNQETRRRQNEFFRSPNAPVQDEVSALEAIPYVQYEMPPIDDSMFFGLDPSWYAGPSSHGASASTEDVEDEEEEESPGGEDDEYNDENDEEEDPCL